MFYFFYFCTTTAISVCTVCLFTVYTYFNYLPAPIIFYNLQLLQTMFLFQARTGYRQLARNVMFLILKSLYRRLYLIIYIMGILQKHYRDLCNLVTKGESKLTTQTITLSLGYLFVCRNESL